MRRLLTSIALTVALSQPLLAQPTDDDVARGIAEQFVATNPGIPVEQVVNAMRRTWQSLEFVAYHEIAHLLIHEFDLPVLGWEEDAADTLAVALLVGNEDGDTYATLTAAIQEWSMATNDPSTLTNEQFYDEHSLNLQRAYHATCLLIGRNAERYAPIAEMMDMPMERREKCEWISKRALDSWRTVLEPHLLAADMARDGGDITIEYAAPDPGLNEMMALMLRDMRFLEKIAPLVTENFNLPREIQFAAGDCGFPGAFFQADPGLVAICYEMASARFDAFLRHGLAQNTGMTDPERAPEVTDTEADPSVARFGTGTSASGSWSISVESDGTWSGTDTTGAPIRSPTTLTTKGLDDVRSCPGRGTWPNCIAD
ncbi:DUF4344 domain-containing metallopeptidase [Maritimibacter sp. UBA3975]|uniref:DUF4344 domain-containing metallopeptidase n=1 Tax=Maritimibacter sp. UBA3975 TaxID=1946833 RepID=UPI000C0B7AF7|nr:DUF4344 domain-containing metallopeptidase [Maritimibacter sp. UBA3975]MAM63496.1 hypothetical protein [Maritimibacter sp.]|tara:strand:- start:111630 stop:112742 length:1113 start_codon:yes stop_codon:yes gene_type:complete